MNGQQFIRRVRKWANSKGHTLVVEKSRGKGGHQIVRIASNWTTVKTGEIKTGLLNAMLDQLGIPKDVF